MIELKSLISTFIPTFDLGQNKIKLCRHTMESRKDGDWKDFNERLMFNSDLLTVFTGSQTKDIFKSAELVLSFVKTQGTKCILRGAFWSNGLITHNKFITKFPAYSELDGFKKANNLDRINEGNGFFYDLEPCLELQPLINRLVIDWGISAQSWVQSKLDKPVVELKPNGFVEKFPGWENVLLSHIKLKAILSNPDANYDWYEFLSGHDGVYVIRDKETNRLYIGSAYSTHTDKGGLWGRWLGYSKTGHNNNKGLVALTQGDDSYADRNYIYSIHYVIPQGMNSAAQVQKYESLLKEKLGSREGVDKLNFN